MTRWPAAVAAIGALLVAISVWRLEAVKRGLDITHHDVAGIPVTVHSLAETPLGPPVVIAHGFAGSRQIMQSFAITLAHNGYTAVSFDFQGHGRNPTPLGGDVTDESGATERLLADMATVARHARDLTDQQRIAILGHSMASDIVVRYATRDPEVAATVTVSMFSPALTAEHPRNLLVVVGALESERLKAEGLRAVELAHPETDPVPARTYGAFADGSARRVAFAPGVEHVGVLFSAATLDETVTWLDRVFEREGTGALAVRGPWIALLVLAVGLLAWPMARVLPRVSDPPLGATLAWRPFLMVVAIPAVLTPLVLWKAPTDFLAMLVGDYLVAHFALFGAIQIVCLRFLGHRFKTASPSGPLVLACALSVAYGVGAVALVLDRYFTAFVPTGDRLLLAALMAVAMFTYFAADEWAARGGRRDWARLLVSRAVFLISLLAAVALNLQDLFFLIILIPMILVFFVLYGALASAANRRTGHPMVGACVSAAALAWAVASVFPILAAG